MSRSKIGPVPDEQRTKIEERHAVEMAALADHAAAADRLRLAEARRADVIADQDQRVAEARADRMEAATVLVGLIGVDRTSDLTGLTVAELRRSARATGAPRDGGTPLNAAEERCADA